MVRLLLYFAEARALLPQLGGVTEHYVATTFWPVHLNVLYPEVATLVRGERTEHPDQGLGFAFGPRSAARRSELQTMVTRTLTEEQKAAAEDTLLPPRWRRFEAPGTYVIVLGFLAWFVLMYVVSHIGLSRVWPVS